MNPNPVVAIAMDMARAVAAAELYRQTGELPAFALAELERQRANLSN